LLIFLNLPLTAIHANSREIDANSFEKGLMLGRLQQVCRTFELGRVDAMDAKILMIDAYSELGEIYNYTLSATFKTVRKMHSASRSVRSEP